MGGNIDGNNAKGIGQTERGTKGTKGTKGTESRNTTPTSTATETRTGTGTGAGTGAGTDTKKEVVPRMAVVNDTEEQKRQERNAKRRERYAQQKAENGQTVKPRKVTNKKQEDVKAIDKASLNVMIAGLSSIIASRPDCEHWLLSEKEIDSITTPLCNMLAESEAFKGLGNYSNQIALVMACVTIILPRLVVTLSKQKAKKGSAISGQRTDTNAKLDTGTKGNDTVPKNKPNTKTDRPNQRNITNAGTNNVDDVSVYGLPIAY